MDIPLEIYHRIFSRLHGVYILRCAQVCRAWYRAINNDILWQKIISRELEGSRQLNSSVVRIWRERVEGGRVIGVIKYKNLRALYVQLRREYYMQEIRKKRMAESSG